MLYNTFAYIVEDDARSLLAITALLKDLGISFKRNTTGAQVAVQLETMNPKPDFILLNTDLPEGDAFEICCQIRQNAVLERVPILAIADSFQTEQINILCRAGFSGFLNKPLPRKHFPCLLQYILDGRPVMEFCHSLWSQSLNSPPIPDCSQSLPDAL